MINQQNYEIIDDRNKHEFESFWMIRANEYFLNEEGDLYVKLNINSAFCLNDNKLVSFQSDDKVTRLENVTIRYQ